MKYELKFLPEVEEDLLEAYIWYENKLKGLGEDFLRIFYASVNEIWRNPLQFQRVHREIRRKLIRRFPYAVYFIIQKKCNSCCRCISLCPKPWLC